MKRFLLLLSTLFAAQAAASRGVGNLRCEYLTAPIGIGTKEARLGWEMLSTEQNAGQSGYALALATHPDRLEDGPRIESGEMRATAGGLEPFTEYWWRVSVWDERGRRLRSPVATFETGMLSTSDWQGEWIGDGLGALHKPAPCFRREFRVEKPVASARLYITSAGLNVVRLNGGKVGESELDPAYTKFDRRTLGSAFDVTRSIRRGANAIGVTLGNGWYNHQSSAVWDFHRAYWRARPVFLLNLRIVYADGSVETIVTDSSWRTVDSGPIRFNSIYTAEHYDARLETPGWDEAGFDDSAWRTAVETTSPTREISAQTMHPYASPTSCALSG
ncbi:MAG: alpha-L-rhamnosidase N-terminal domain-containing protein [Rikenellaceae bacterium]|jgi:alpha-L-rhamnosidase|nr:alpha-L-rhamnosidase N-terminal domain-containing protein [Rikenellaceae bacterium]